MQSYEKLARIPIFKGDLGFMIWDFRMTPLWLPLSKGRAVKFYKKYNH